jgi:hypothetical protein
MKQDSVADSSIAVAGFTKANAPEWQLTQRIVASPGFAKSGLLIRFLLYIVDRKLRHLEHEITEQQIGVHALGRPSAYDPADDNIVRNYARILRRRLEGYFEREGAEEQLRIVVPRGTYVPVFEPNRHIATAAPEPLSVLEAPPPHERGRSWALIAAVALALIAAALLVRWSKSRPPGPDVLYGQFWGEVFEAKRPALVITADSGLGLLQDLTGESINLHDYVTSGFQKNFAAFDLLQPGHVGTFGIDRFSNYTSTSDLSIALSLSELAQFAHAHAKVRYARAVEMEDLKGSNVVLLGGIRANPWVELFEPFSQFRTVLPTRQNGLHLDQKSFINLHPRPGEQPSYDGVWNDSSHHTYTLVSFLPSSDHAGHALLIQGQNMAGTQAGADFLFDPRAMWPILHKARLEDGALGCFEVLLEATAVGANAPEPRAVVERYESDLSSK